MKQNFVFHLHSTAGLVSGIFILLMSLSGAVLVFHSQIDAVQLPAVVSGNPKRASVDSCYHLVRQAYPAAQVSNCRLPENSNGPVSFVIYDPSYKSGKAAMEVFVDPRTAAIFKTRGNDSQFTSRLSTFHSSLFLGKTGEWLLGFFALVFLLSLGTGLILFWKNIAAVLLFRRSAYKTNNLHQLIGVYALLFNLLMAGTGFWMQRYVFKKEFYAVDLYTPVLKKSPALPFNFEEAYKAIKKTYPDFTAQVIYFAQSNAGKTAVYGSRSSNGYIHSKKFADAIFLDSAGGIAKTRFVNEISADDRYDIINSQLHMGRFGGTGIQLIYFVFGLTGALLSISGFLLWIRRSKDKKLPGRR
jgi:uncharacterized iron-regulated membrane protein